MLTKVNDAKSLMLNRQLWCALIFAQAPSNLVHIMAAAAEVLKAYKVEFIEFALSREVLQFGTFTLKSGRKSPYFFNFGKFQTGKDLAVREYSINVM